MGYLEQFARKRRTKEKTEVLTARLPESLYGDFKKHCDELGISISEAVYLLVEKEMNTNEYTKIQDESAATTEATTKEVKAKQKTSNLNTNRFTTKQFIVNGELPCPICEQWASASNFSRHAKQHDMTTQELFTSEEYQEKVQSMITEKKK